MTALILLLVLLTTAVGALITVGTGRNRTPGDRIDGTTWFDIPHPTNRHARRTR